MVGLRVHDDMANTTAVFRAKNKVSLTPVPPRLR